MAFRRSGIVAVYLSVAAILLGAAGCGAGSVMAPPAGGSLVPGMGVSNVGGETWATGDAPDDPYGPTVPCDVTGQPADAIHQEMLDVLNAYRTNNHLSALTYSKRLETAADAHAKDLWRRNFFEHTNPDGEGPGQRALRAGFCHSYVGENIAEGDGLPTVAAVQAGWVASPGHNANMLNEPYRFVGMGHYYDPATGCHYWVQDFALPKQ